MGFTIVLKLFRGTLVNIKAGSRKINRKWLRSIVAKIALWNDPLGVPQNDLSSTIVVSRCYNDLNVFPTTDSLFHEKTLPYGHRRLR